MSQPIGSYVVFGHTMPPQVHLLSANAHKLYAQRQSVAFSEKAKADVYRVTFGTGAEIALPAWSLDCMVMIAERYEGPHQVQLRGLCAAIALGKPFGPDEHGGGGGMKVPAKPTPPAPTSPSPAFFSADADKVAAGNVAQIATRKRSKKS